MTIGGRHKVHKYPLTDPEIPVRFGPQLLIGTIINYEDPYAATIQITLYHVAPPLVYAYPLARDFPWLQVHDAWSGAAPLIWY